MNYLKKYFLWMHLPCYKWGNFLVVPLRSQWRGIWDSAGPPFAGSADWSLFWVPVDGISAAFSLVQIYRYYTMLYWDLTIISYKPTEIPVTKYQYQVNVTYLPVPVLYSTVPVLCRYRYRVGFLGLIILVFVDLDTQLRSKGSGSVN
jgi:hypothetical protein